MRPRTGTIFKRGNTYWLRYQVDGKRVAESLGTTKKREAETEAEKRMAPIRAADKAAALQAIAGRLNDAEATAAALYDEANPPLSFGQAWAAYLETERRPADGSATLKNYMGHLDAFTTWLDEKHPGTKYLRDVTPGMAAAFIKHLAARGLSGQRINKYLTFLRAFFRELAKPARLAANPFEGIHRRKQTGTSKRPLTIEELRAVIDTAEGELKTLLVLGTFTGLRLADACTLRWDEIDMARGIIRRIPRKTAYKGEAVIIGIPAYLADHLGRLKRRGPFVVPDTAARYESDAQGLSRRIQGHFTQCGIETIKPGTGGDTGKRAVVIAGFHSLRHSFVSLHAQAGTPQAILQKLAGHGNPIMTEHYTHLTDETALAVAANLPALAAEPEPTEPTREPLPAWAVEAVKSARTLKALRAELLGIV